MKERSCRRSRKSVIMPPTLRYSSSSSGTSKAKKRPSTRMRMRPWLEDLLNKGSCQGLSWKDRSKNIFTIEWRHASSHGFDQSVHGDVFSKWAQHTGKITTRTAGNHSSNKSNFRCALHSLKDCIELTEKGDKKGEKAKRTFQFIDQNHPQYNKKRKQSAMKKSAKVEEDSEESSSDATTTKHEEELSEASFDSSSERVSTSACIPAQPLQFFSGNPMNTRSHSTSPISGTSASKPLFLRQTSHNFLHSTLGGSPLTYSEPDIPHSRVPDLDTLLDTSSNGASQQKWNTPLGSSKAASPPMIFTTETSPDGITTIILQPTTSSCHNLSSPPVACKAVTTIKKEPMQDSQSVETKDKTYEPLRSHLNNKLNCGGEVKIMIQKPETLQLQLPEFQIQQQTQAPPNQSTVDDSQFDIGSTMEVQDESFEPSIYDSSSYQSNDTNYDSICGMDQSLCEIYVTDMDTDHGPSGHYIQLLCPNAVSEIGKSDQNN